ncbi:MAG TPA: bacillithiol biosynthesis deacetylase BshB1 [Actinomycetota bacterium]|nr:bacillithiol biosynthesis deacetylase BshB1 [Actinomycetota bacterium]
MNAFDIVAFGAHPDDAEIGCGATLVMAAAAGRRVAIVDLTAGEQATRGSVEEREKERRRAAETLGIDTRPCLCLPDAALGSDPVHRDRIVEIMRDLRPRIVLAPMAPDRHPDHAAAGRLVAEASYLSGLSTGSPPQRPARVYHYMIHHPITPSFVVDAAPGWAQKMAALRCHESQFDDREPRTAISGGSFLEVIDARGVYFGSLIGAARGEPFWSAGPVPQASLPDITADGYGAYP